MADTAKEARQDLCQLLEDANLGFEGGHYAYIPRPGDAVTPFTYCWSDGQTPDNAFYRVRLTLVVTARDDAQGAQDDRDDHAEIVERLLQGQDAYYPPGWTTDYDETLDAFTAEWNLQVHKGS